MKRFLLGLIMVSGLAIAAAPMANAANAPSYICGKHFAFQVTGTEPVTATAAAATYPLNYIAGVGVLEFGPYTAATETCTITGGEMIYLDNDYETFQGGPQDCPSVTSLEGIPCFDGADHVIEGGVGPGPNGSATVAFAMDFPFVLGGSNTTLPFSFTVFATGGGATLEGNSNIPEGGSGAGDTASNPSGSCEPPYDPVTGCGPNAPTAPLGPVVAFVGQRQATSAALNPVPTVVGVAPYIGNSATLCTGFGGNSSDLVASAEATQTDEATGTYGATSGSLTEFANGYAFGSLTFNTNDDVGNTTGVANYDCDFQQQNFQAFGDGATNNQAALYDEYYPTSPSPICRDGDAGLTVPQAVGADEVNSSVLWGTTDQNTYTIVTGVATPAAFGGAYLPPGETASCVGLQESAIPGTITLKASPASETDSGPTFPQTKSIALTIVNTSEGACTEGAELVKTSGPASLCTLTLSAPGVISEGDGPQSGAWTANCTCTAKLPAETDTYDLFGGSSTNPPGVGGCPNPPQAITPIALTCKN